MSVCVGSGLCCKTGPCPYGIWNEEKNQCDYLITSYEQEDKNIQVYRCGNYAYIKKQPGNEWAPAFGAGCCMSLFNENRKNIIQEINSGNKKIINILSL